MHDTALHIGRLFFELYGTTARDILDIGSMDINGALRRVAPPAARFVGLDAEPGPGVDVVAELGGQLPFDDASFDLVTSSSAFEHDPLFWQTVIEMARVTRPRGFIYINAPSNGHYHAHPLDCWRFYADAGLALARWVNRIYAVELVESFTARRVAAPWNDTVIVLQRAPFLTAPATLLCDSVDCINVRRRGERGLERFQEPTDDQALISYLARNSKTLLERWQAVVPKDELVPVDRLSELHQLRFDTEEFLKTFGVTG